MVTFVSCVAGCESSRIRHGDAAADVVVDAGAQAVTGIAVAYTARAGRGGNESSQTFTL